MATILLGWELGEGLGHVHLLLKIARALAAEGHRPVFALCNVVEAWALMQQDPFPVLQAPYWNYRAWRREQPFLAASLADVLAVRGWETVATLSPLVKAWQDLLDSVQPQLIVTDYAPTLCLAAYQSLPVVQVGNWFHMVPVHTPTFPLLVPGQLPVVPQEQLLAVVQVVQRRRQRPVPPTLTSILLGNRFPAFFPDLDPYQAVRTETLWEPVEELPPLLPPCVEPHFFAYLSADNPRVEPFLTQMVLTGCRGTAYLRSAPADLKERLRLQGLVVLDQPAPLERMFAQATVIVHHGGGMVSSALTAGRPQILLPQHLEQITTAQRIARLGVGVFILGNASPEAAGRALRQVLDDRRYTDNAVAWARRFHQQPRRPTLPAILACCRKHLQGSA